MERKKKERKRKRCNRCSHLKKEERVESEK